MVEGLGSGDHVFWRFLTLFMAILREGLSLEILPIHLWTFQAAHSVRCVLVSLLCIDTQRQIPYVTEFEYESKCDEETEEVGVEVRALTWNRRAEDLAVSSGIGIKSIDP